MFNVQVLTQVGKTQDISIYEIQGDHTSAIKRYIASTAQTRRICNVPEVLGHEYTSLLEQAVTLALKHLPAKEQLVVLPEDSFSVLVFMRGGLNFGIRSALHEAYGFNRHGSSFMTSQRYRRGDRWRIREDQYRKFEIPQDATIIAGDVVATGTTLANGLSTVWEYINERNIRVRNFIFFTIGCHKVEKILEEYDQKFREGNPQYGETSIIYFEGKFKLIDSKTNLRIQIQGTDLIRAPALLAPEFELSQYDNVAFPLERCTIYDAGSRAFHIPEYMKDVVEYWGEVRKLAEQGFTLYDALKERWTEQGYDQPFEQFAAVKRTEWKDVDEQTLKAIYGAYQQRWTSVFLERARTSNALVEVCDQRLATLKR